MIITGRQYTSPNIYRYGFNGKEHDDDLTAGDYDFGARIYDPRTGRFLSLDPQSGNYPSISPYCFAANTPIQAIDEEGENPITIIVGIFLGAGTEIVGQVFGSLLSHHSFGAALKSIDWADVLHAAIAGGLNGILPGITYLSTVQKAKIGTLISIGNALLNAEFDYNTHNEDGKRILKKRRFKFGFGDNNNPHQKDSDEVLKDVLKSAAGIFLDLTTHLGDKIAAVLEDKFGLTKQITSDGTDPDKGVSVSSIVAAIIAVFHETHIDRREDQLLDLAKPGYRRGVHRRNRGSHNNAKKKNHKQHPRGHKPRNNINFRHSAHTY